MSKCERENGGAVRRDAENKYEIPMNERTAGRTEMERKKVREIQNERLTGRVTARGVMLKGDVVTEGTPDCPLKFKSTVA